MTRIALEEDAINLSQGLPDFAPPQVLIDAAKSAIGSTNDQYSITYGDAGLRSAISEDLFGVIGHRYDPESEITVTCGVSEGIIAAIMAVVNPGDGGGCFVPFFVN
ncbi:MAG: aminotransferase class I/II-fold pyridoxal phosphate-dependent enzyme [FCB group bacterium]|nr:aminotransferase class I/II-fold pyridoxal phosphate-dependent enzyme [FCB group bacterium]